MFKYLTFPFGIFWLLLGIISTLIAILIPAAYEDHEFSSGILVANMFCITGGFEIIIALLLIFNIYIEKKFIFIVVMLPMTLSFLYYIDFSGFPLNLIYIISVFSFITIIGTWQKSLRD